MTRVGSVPLLYDFGTGEEVVLPAFARVVLDGLLLGIERSLSTVHSPTRKCGNVKKKLKNSPWSESTWSVSSPPTQRENEYATSVRSTSGTANARLMSRTRTLRMHRMTLNGTPDRWEPENTQAAHHNVHQAPKHQASSTRHQAPYIKFKDLDGVF